MIIDLYILLSYMIIDLYIPSLIHSRILYRASQSWFMLVLISVHQSLSESVSIIGSLSLLSSLTDILSVRLIRRPICILYASDHYVCVVSIGIHSIWYHIQILLRESSSGIHSIDLWMNLISHVSAIYIFAPLN